jgi:hypothetical protein
MKIVYVIEEGLACMASHCGIKGIDRRGHGEKASRSSSLRIFLRRNLRAAPSSVCSPLLNEAVDFLPTFGILNFLPSTNQP